MYACMHSLSNMYTVESEVNFIYLGLIRE